MMDVKTLVSAATLKGYLLATDAPKAIVLLAEQIVEAVTNAISSEHQTLPRLRNEDVKLPDPASELAEATSEISKTVPSHDELRFAEPEPAHERPEEADSEVKDEVKHASATTPPERTIDRAQIVPAILPEVDMQTARGRNPENIWEDWQIETLIRMKGEGAKTSAIALELNKTPQQVSNKWAWLPKTVKKLKPAVDEGGWPVMVRPSKPAPSEPDTRPASNMTFKTVTTTARRKGRWGEYDYSTTEVVAQPETTYSDPETGAQVTKYPPGYARGAFPQRNVSVKGGS